MCAATASSMLFGMNTTTDSTRRIEGFEDTVKDFWVSRPRRPHRGRKLAGVAAGIGHRYGIDPAIVRVVFVVLTVFGGVGLAFYLLGWAILPEEGDDVSGLEGLLGKGRSSMSKGFTLALCAALVLLGLASFSASWVDGGTFVGLALVVAGVYLLHRSRGHLRRPAPTGGVATGPAGMTSTGTGGDAGMWGQPVSQAAPTWDPLGADPLGWRLPDATAPTPPPPEPPPPPRRKSKIGFAVTGVALAVGGVGAALAAEGVPWFTPAHVMGLVLAVLGLGMVAGSFLGGGRGLVWLAVPLALVGLTLSAVPLEHVGGGFGELRATPTSADQVQPVYERTAGDVQLDLTGLSGSDSARTTVRSGAGNVTVLLPPDADVDYRCEAAVGNVECLGQEHNGIDTPELRGVDPGTDGEGGPKITLTAKIGAGNVEVRRG
ncbi:putative stress-responsive transcriptional regulator [Saccharomonospora cyanea NA-134]|uniref:Putative stress-responsive transcriptional regulator n=2 Tax=Saccharomonospora cyanea TaxID=40989 RepID=H5XH32_9PSEU|nr:putative stress-responsive transcriptional regulator [Saccharomonospora cyanea NA-134]